MPTGIPMLSVPHFRPEARRNPGLAASCLMSIRYSVRYVLQGRYQGLSLFAAAFDLTWLTCLSSQNGHLPGILRSPVQITYVTAALDAGVPLRDVQEAASHADPRTTMRYARVGPRQPGPARDLYRRRLRRRRRQVMAHPLAQLRPAVAAAGRSCPNNTAVTHGDPKTNANRRSVRRLAR